MDLLGKMDSHGSLWQGYSEEKKKLEEDTEKWKEGMKMNEIRRKE